MRKIEQKMVAAAFGKESIKLGNTTVEYRPEISTPVHSRMETSRIFLHGNHIATVIHDPKHQGRVVVNEETLQKWSTDVTKSRLRALGVNVYTKKGVTYLNDLPVN